MPNLIGSIAFTLRGYNIIADVAEYQDGLYVPEWYIDMDTLSEHECDLLYENAELHRDVEATAIDLFIERAAEAQLRKREG